MDREQALVELVDEHGRPAGTASVADAHRSPGRLHRAFSVVLHDHAGRVLLQQRAAAKTRFALRWSNACCGHPQPAEDVRAAAARRLQEEMGLRWASFTEPGIHLYRATDSRTGRVEHEYDHVLADAYEGPPPRPDADEVADWRWAARSDLAADLIRRPSRYTPWLAGILSVVPDW